MAEEYMSYLSNFEKARLKYFISLFPRRDLSFSEVEDETERARFKSYSDLMNNGNEDHRGRCLWERTNSDRKHDDDTSIWITLAMAYLCIERSKIFRAAMIEDGVRILRFSYPFSEKGPGLYISSYLQDYESVSSKYEMPTGQKVLDLNREIEVQLVSEEEAPHIVLFILRYEGYIQKDLNHLIDVLLEQINNGETKIERPESYSAVVTLVNKMRREQGMSDYVSETPQFVPQFTPQLPTFSPSPSMQEGDAGRMTFGTTPSTLNIFANSGFVPQDGFGSVPFGTISSSSSPFQFSQRSSAFGGQNSSSGPSAFGTPSFPPPSPVVGGVAPIVPLSVPPA